MWKWTRWEHGKAYLLPALLLLLSCGTTVQTLDISKSILLFTIYMQPIIIIFPFTRSIYQFALPYLFSKVLLPIVVSPKVARTTLLLTIMDVVLIGNINLSLMGTYLLH